MSQSILQLNAATPTTASRIPFGDPGSGLDYACALSAILALLAPASTFQTQYAAPNVSGFAINIAPAATGGNVWLLVTPNAGYAALTLNLPAGTDGQEIVVNVTQSVTTLTVTGATVGAAPQPVYGAPTTLAANAHFRLKFDGVTGAWYAI